MPPTNLCRPANLPVCEHSEGEHHEQDLPMSSFLADVLKQVLTAASSPSVMTCSLHANTATDVLPLRGLHDFACTSRGFSPDHVTTVLASNSGGLLKSGAAGSFNAQGYQTRQRGSLLRRPTIRILGGVGSADTAFRCSHGNSSGIISFDAWAASGR